MSRSTSLTTLYATDEDAYTLAGADWAVIVPKSNLFASGTDGVFASNARWTLASASNDFATQGVAAGMVVQLVTTGSGTPFSTPQYLAVDTVSSGSLGLRRCGYDAGEGLPPGPAAGATGVTFKIVSLKPQIENAAYELNERYALDPAVAYRTPTDVYDLRVFRRLTVLWVYYQLFASENRTKDGDFAAKAKYFQDEYTAELEKAVLRWGPRGNTQPTTTRFSMRLSR